MYLNINVHSIIKYKMNFLQIKYLYNYKQNVKESH